MRKPVLIFCAGKNAAYAKIATENGYKYGAQLPCKVHAPVYFADQDWKNPSREAYMLSLGIHKPSVATVLDWEREDQLGEVLDWAKEASGFVETIIIIPKVSGIDRIPETIGDSKVRLGYSVPTKFSHTTVKPEEFLDREVHLLGGSPGAQMRLCGLMNVVSADGNMMMKMANRGLFWLRGKGEFSNKWVSLKQADGKRWEGNGNHEAFRRSCVNIMSRWDSISS